MTTIQTSTDSKTDAVGVRLKAEMLARLRSLAISYQEEGPFSMHPLAEREWERILESAAEEAFNAGATEEEVNHAEHARD